MKNYFQSSIMMMFVIINTFYNANDWDTIQYYISHENVDEMIIAKDPMGEYTITLKLNELSRIEFAILTRENIGRMLEIMWDETLLVQAVIKAEIESGIITFGNFKSEKEAEEIKSQILDKQME